LRRDKFRAGDGAIVCSPQEILSTLDANGTLDGLPFMPEMLDWCGKHVRVLRRVEKTCVEIDSPGYIYPNRRFADNDVVILEGPRCDGRDHDGCQRGCRIYWKEAWLRTDKCVDTPTSIAEAGLAALRARLKVRAEEPRYFCQSTELFKATEEFPGRKKPWMVRIALKEVRNGEIAVPKLAKLFVLWCLQHLYTRAAGGRLLNGPHKKTPSMSLDLKPGDIVRVKTRDQIVQTLSTKGANRGMFICYEMTRLCGKEAEVRSRIDRIIDEKSGKMRQLQNTVMLQNMRGNPTLCEECLCFDEMGDCPRGELMYWREIWLERVVSPRG
jgi:hypothetical protein